MVVGGKIGLPFWCGFPFQKIPSPLYIFIYVPRLSQEIDQNANVNIECKTSANPAPTSFIWTKIGDSRFREEGKYLMLRNVSYRDSGEYACAVTNVLTPTHGVSTSRWGRVRNVLI